MCQTGQCSVSACSRFNMVACSPGQSRPCEVHCQLRSRPETCRPSSQLESLFSQGPVYHGQVWLLTQFCFSWLFLKIITYLPVELILFSEIILFSFVPSCDSLEMYQTELTRCPSRALNLASYIIFGISWIQGHC